MPHAYSSAKVGGVDETLCAVRRAECMSLAPLQFWAVTNKPMDRLASSNWRKHAKGSVRKLGSSHILDPSNHDALTRPPWFQGSHPGLFWSEALPFAQSLESLTADPSCVARCLAAYHYIGALSYRCFRILDIFFDISIGLVGRPFFFCRISDPTFDQASNWALESASPGHFIHLTSGTGSFPALQLSHAQAPRQSSLDR